MLKDYQKKHSGFTLIELIVSLGVFSFVITIAVGALLIVISTSSQLQGEQSVMTNLAFVVDSMTREIRTGTAYFCDGLPNKNASHSGGIDNMFDDATDLDIELGDITRDCENGNNNNRPYHGLSFKEGGDSITGPSDERILYFFDANDHKIYRRVGGGDAQSVVSSGIYIEELEFTVTGSDPQSGGGDDIQPSVTIFIEARENDDSSAKSYYLQTTVTQRQLDI